MHFALQYQLKESGNKEIHSSESVVVVSDCIEINLLIISNMMQWHLYCD